MAHRLPLALTPLRILLAPLMVVLAFAYPSRSAFAVCLIAAFLSDFFDGIIARRLNVAALALRRLDCIADTFFYFSAAYVIWRLYPDLLTPHLLALSILAVLEVSRYLFDLDKFRREASYHMWPSKLWGITLFGGYFSGLVLDSSGLPITLAIYVGIVADVEGLAISLLLSHWRTDVSTLAQAFRLRAIDHH